MLIFYRQIDLKDHLKSIAVPKTSIGFVPTMGALHQGHLSLVQQSLQENDLTVISIFVNPTQFNNPEDLAKYPRTLDNDIEKIKTASEKIIVYAPSVEDIYNGSMTLQYFDFQGLEQQMEGRHRPGHFDGVATVVKKLFEVVNPTNAYFGEKDFQQLQIVKKLVEILKIPVNIIGIPILRTASGLAMSSRNERLSKAEKERAAIIYKILCQAKIKFSTKSALQVSDWVKKSFDKHPDFRLEYFEIADEVNLLPCIRKSKFKKYRAFIAVFLNEVRLIDTISLN